MRRGSAHDWRRETAVAVKALGGTISFFYFHISLLGTRVYRGIFFLVLLSLFVHLPSCRLSPYLALLLTSTIMTVLPFTDG